MAGEIENGFSRPQDGIGPIRASGSYFWSALLPENSTEGSCIEDVHNSYSTTLSLPLAQRPEDWEKKVV